MPKSIRIKDAETHRIAKRLAEITGDSIVGAVTKALKNQLELRNSRE